MIKETFLPKEYVEGLEVRKRIIEQIDQVEGLTVAEKTNIKLHGHKDGQWEVWLWLAKMRAYICLPGEEHELVNKSGEKMLLLTIKGHGDCTYDELGGFFYSVGFSVTHGSLK